MNSQLRLACCTILLPLICCASQQFTKKTFVMVKKCPTNHSRLQQQLADSVIECSAACKSNAACSIFHFNSTGKICYQGSSSGCSGSKFWKDGPCRSYSEEGASSSTAPAAGAAPFPYISGLSLKLLYNFRTHGLVNLVNPAQSTLTPKSVCLTNEGAAFDGTDKSYLLARTPGMAAHLDGGGDGAFSIFVLASHSATGTSMYSVFKQCNGSLTGSSFASYNGDLFSEIVLSNPQLMDSSYATEPIVPRPDKQVAVGIAYSYNGVAYTRNVKYYTGADSLNDITEGEDYTLEEPPNPRVDSSIYECLQLGSELQGSMSCFAVSARALDKYQFDEIRDWCLGASG